ncbi:MAG TPA: ATP synthase F1 subunit delta [Tepidisphaeraceae bacterium]|jgi:F-type H+-transporting ATPase subunit delta
MARNNDDHATLDSYAQALLQLSDARGVTDQVAGDVREISAMIDRDPVLAKYLSDPSISHVERGDKLDRTFSGKTPEVLVGFLKLLNAKGRLNNFGGIAKAFQHLLDLRAGQQDVEVTVAQALNPQELEDVRIEISKKIGKHAQVTQKVDESIIGGLVLKIGDKLIDGSVKTQLETMKRKLIAAV